MHSGSNDSFEADGQISPTHANDLLPILSAEGSVLAFYFSDSFEIDANISYARNPYNSSYPIGGAMVKP